MNNNQKYLMARTLVVLSANPSLVLQLCPRSTSFADVCKAIENRIVCMHEKLLENFCEALAEDFVELELSMDPHFQRLNFHAVHRIDGESATC